MSRLLLVVLVCASIGSMYSMDRAARSVSLASKQQEEWVCGICRQCEKSENEKIRWASKLSEYAHRECYALVIDQEKNLIEKIVVDDLVKNYVHNNEQLYPLYYVWLAHKVVMVRNYTHDVVPDYSLKYVHEKFGKDGIDTCYEIGLTQFLKDIKRSKY